MNYTKNQIEMENRIHGEMIRREGFENGKLIGSLLVSDWENGEFPDCPILNELFFIEQEPSDSEWSNGGGYCSEDENTVFVESCHDGYESFVRDYLKSLNK